MRVDYERKEIPNSGQSDHAVELVESWIDGHEARAAAFGPPREWLRRTLQRHFEARLGRASLTP